MTYEESQTLIRIYDHHNGNWKAILDEPEIKALNMSRPTLQKRMSYLRAASKKEEPPDLSYVPIVSITARKKTQKTKIMKWHVSYENGYQRWVKENTFIDFDGTRHPLFLEFQAKHPGDADVHHAEAFLKRSTCIIEDTEQNMRKKKRLICLKLLKEWIDEEQDELNELKSEIGQLREEIAALKAEIKK